MTERSKGWNPINNNYEDDEYEPDEESLDRIVEEEEPCEGCLEKATQEEASWVEDIEQEKRTEESLKQELTIKQAERTYQVARDA